MNFSIYLSEIEIKRKYGVFFKPHEKYKQIGKFSFKNECNQML